MVLFVPTTHLVIRIYGQVELRLLLSVQFSGQADDATDRVYLEVAKRVSQGIAHLVVNSCHTNTTGHMSSANNANILIYI